MSLGGTGDEIARFAVRSDAGLALDEPKIGITDSPPFDDDEFDLNARLELFRLLPAFRVGIGTLIRLHQRGATLLQAVDDLGLSLLALDWNGREVYRSGSLQKLLTDDPDAGDVIQAMHELADALVRLRRASETDWPSVEGIGPREVGTAHSRYTIRGSYLPAEISGTPTILMALERLAPELPSAASLVERFALTPRQAEVALWLAGGASNRQIAEGLGISAHTVRAHAEHLFAKLGIHSRKALALRLVRDGHP